MLVNAKRQKRDLHALDEDAMVICNPRDKEAAHWAQTEGIGYLRLVEGDVPQMSVIAP